jgi:hypothetical protein
MEARTQDAPDYYVWATPGSPVVIHLHLDVLDRLGSEVMRGFGAVPKRGAEVGGVLIGTVEPGPPGDPAVVCDIVRIEDFEPFDCSYKRGPSYLLTEDEHREFDEAVRRWQPDLEQPAYVVGFYRSHTREGLALSPEDIQLLDEFFPNPDSVMLLIKPYGTKVSEAGFFVREDGAFPGKSPLEFPFRRHELSGEEPPPRRSIMEPRLRGRAMTSAAVDPMPRPGADRFAQPASIDPTTLADADRNMPAKGVHTAMQADLDSDDPQDDSSGGHSSGQPPRIPDPRAPLAAGAADAVTLPSRFSSSIWIPLSFVFLLFGVALGMMISMQKAPKAASNEAQNFTLGLTVAKSGENLSVKWDPLAPAVREAEQGSIEIQDGSSSPQSKPLDTAQLQNGRMIYTNSSSAVKFTLIVHPRTQLSVAETVEWRP